MTSLKDAFFHIGWVAPPFIDLYSLNPEDYTWRVTPFQGMSRVTFCAVAKPEASRRARLLAASLLAWLSKMREPQASLNPKPHSLKGNNAIASLHKSGSVNFDQRLVP